jgi:CHAT domain-containing protein
MQEATQQAYLKLVQQLLNCESGQEQEILAAHEEIVNEALVATIFAAAQEIEQQNGESAEGSRLMSFGVHLAEKLGITTGDKSSKIQFEFLLAVLRGAADGEGDPQWVYPLLQQNLELLDESLIELLQGWARKSFADSEPEEFEKTVKSVGNFGLLMQNFPLGDRTINMEMALTSYELLLEVFTIDTNPKIWAITQNNLANAYLNRPKGDRTKNLEEAITGYDAALRVRTKNAFPVQWAGIQYNRANAYSERIKGDKAENIEEAIAGYEASLQVYTRTAFPTHWATIQNLLANAYLERIRGNRAENLEEVIARGESSLQMINRKDFPAYWAITQNILAAAYRKRIRGSRAENIEEAIARCDTSLQICTRQDFPAIWAMTQHGRANAYSERIKGDKAENIEEAIAGYESSLQIHTQKDFPIDWARTQNDLAIVNIKRIKGDKAENIEKAIARCDTSLQIYTRQDFPVEWAATQNNLATAYRNRIKGDKAENIEKAIICCEAALEVMTCDAFPEQWAQTQNNLANAYCECIKGDRAENLEKAIAGYEAALQVRTYQAFPIDWAMTQVNLATAYTDRIKGDRSKNQEVAIASCDASLQVYTRAAFPINWAMTQNNRANAYVYMARNRGDGGENIEVAITGYQAALEIFTPRTLPIDCFKTARSLGHLHFQQGQWQQASTAYELAMDAVETARSWAVDDSRRREILRDALNIYENAIQCAVNLQNYAKAIQYTERIRSRQLVELMASKDLYRDAQVPPGIQVYLDEYHQLNQDIENLQDGSNDLRKATTQIQVAEIRKQQLYSQIRTYDPVLAGQIEIAPIDYTEIQALITNAQTAILSCYSTHEDTYVFILKQNQEPELLTCQGQGKTELQQWLGDHWLVPYKQKDNRIWQEKMPEILAEIADRLQLSQLVTKHLTGIQELIIIPHLLLHQVPFAALPIPNTNELLGERCTLRFIPSCQILQYCQQRPPVTAAIQGIVEDADGSLLGARYEGHKIAEIYQVKMSDRLRGKTQSTVANYRQLLSRVNRLHSIHHAGSRFDNPLESALKLGDGQITLGDLLLGERYPQLDEVFLSACETHVGNFTLTDDVTTLSTGFLCIGARSVQSTLWSVNDLVTALFNIFYHQERREGYNRAISLQRSQLRLRQLSGKEFNLNYYPELQQFLDESLATELDAIEQRCTELEFAKKTATKENLDKILAELAGLEGRYKFLEKELGSLLRSYGQQAYPFAAPYYWAGFVCQGMA